MPPVGEGCVPPSRLGTRWAVIVTPVTSGPDDETRAFGCKARDPDDVEFVIQVVPSYGASGPVFIAGDDPLKQGPVLRFVNRLLVRLQRPSSFEQTELVVIRVSDDEIVHSESVADLGAGRQRAIAIAEQIAVGTFSGS